MLCIFFYCSFTILVGSEYYIGFFQNSHDHSIISLRIAKSGLLDLSYTIESPGIGYYLTGNITDTESTIVHLPSSLRAYSYHDQNKGIHLKINTTNVTVTGQNLFSSDGDTFLALPTEQGCCSEYVYYGISVSSGSGDSVVLIVGTENDTVMNLTATQPVNIKVNDAVISLHRGIEYSFIVNRLKTVYIGSSHDLTGTKIVTNKPVSVFSGHRCGYVPSSEYNDCDHLIEQIPPTTYWGETYYTAPLQGRNGYTIRVLAAYNSTEVITDCNNTRNFYTINAGNAFTATYQSYCMIHSNKEILVAQYSHGYDYDSKIGNPMMMLVPATVHYSNEINLSTASSSGYNNYINIIVLKEYYQPSMMYWISGGVKRSLKSQSWNAIKFNQVTEAYYTQLSVSNSTVKIAHTSTTALFSAFVYGFRRHGGYGHSGGLHTRKRIRG